MEFIVQTNLETIPQQIQFNKDELMSALQERLNYYNSLVVTEDGMKGAKSDRANLNRLKSAMEDKRKDIKRACLAPYEAFEKDYREVLELIEQPILSIDSQVKKLEEIQLEEKRKEVEAFYQEAVGDLRSLVSFEQVVDPKWRNKGMTVNKLTEGITAEIERINSDVSTIKALQFEKESIVLDVYFKTLNVSDALAEKSRIEEQEKRLRELEEARKREAEALEELQKQEPETQEAIEVVTHPPVETPFLQPEIAPIEAEIVATEEETKTIKVIYYDTTQAFRDEMKALTVKHSVRYGGIK